MRSSGQSSRCSGRQESGNRGSRRAAASRDGLTASSVSDGPAMLPAGLAVVPARAVPAADCSCVVGPAARAAGDFGSGVGLAGLIAGAADFSGSAVQLAVSAGLDVGLAGPAVAASSVSARTAAGRVVAVAVCSDSAVGPVVAAASADFAVLVATERAVVAARAVVVASLLAGLPFVPVVRTQGQSQPKIRTILPFRSLQISSLKVPQLQARRRVHK